jgi:hypothetical protein
MLVTDEELIAAAERDSKRQALQPTDHFEKLLKATCSNHTYPVRHKLKECTMMKNYMTTGIFIKVKRPKGCRPFPRGECGHVDLQWASPPRVMMQAQAYWLSNQRHKHSGPRVLTLV